MKKLLLLVTISLVFACNDKQNKKETAREVNNDTAAVIDTEAAMENPLNITPISHATMVIEWDGTVMYTDPVGGAEAFTCLLYTSPSPRDKRQSRMPSSA